MDSSACNPLTKRPANAMRLSNDCNAASGNSGVESNASYQDHVEKNKKLKTGRPFNGVSTRLTINPEYTTDSFRKSVRSLLRAYAEGPNAPADADISLALNYVFRKPFRHMVFPEFFRGPVDEVEMELLSQKFDSLSTDLFQLSQTKELASDRVSEFALLSDTFRDDVRPWVQEITGVELKQDVDMRGARYTYTDRLVCHDDRLSSRKIAYVYYLTQSDWSAEDGGSLDLYESICKNDNLVPGELEKSVLPLRNSLVLFFVSDDSFHEVSEVLSLTKPRLSLTGWFHTARPPKPRVEYQDTPEARYFQFLSTTAADARICRLAKTDDAAMKRAKNKYRSELTKHHATEVRHLFTEDFYQSSVMELRKHDHNLPWVVPVNRNSSGRYRYVDIPPDFQWTKEMPLLNQLVHTFFSSQFLQSLMDISGRQLGIARQKDKPSEKREGVNGTVKPSRQDTARFAISAYQFRLERFEHGDYTLKHFDAVQTDNVLDLFYFIDCDRLERDCGGSIVFVEIEDSPADEDWDPMVQIDGSSNCLSIVSRDQGYVFYTEYVNHRWIRRNAGRPFYRLWVSLPIDTDDTAESSSESEQQNGSSAEEDELQEPDEVSAALSNSETDGEEEDE